MTKKKIAELQLSKRAEVRRLSTSTQRRWYTDDKAHCLIEVKSTLHRPTRYLVVSCVPYEVIVSEHRSKAAAVQVLTKLRSIA